MGFSSHRPLPAYCVYAHLKCNNTQWKKFFFIYLIYQKSHGQNQSNFYEAPYLHILIVILLLHAATAAGSADDIKLSKTKYFQYILHTETEKKIIWDKEKLHIIPSHSLEIFIIRVARYYI